MDSTIQQSSPPNRSRIAKSFQKAIHLRRTSKNRSSSGFCIPIPQEKQCLGIESAEETRNRASMEAFLAKLFASVSSLKAAYAELQTAQFPYNIDNIKSADQDVVEELKSLSELKRKYSKKHTDSSSPPHVTLMLSEIQEQQSLMKTYEITMRKLQSEVENKESQISYLQEKLKEIVQKNKSLEKKMNKSGSFSVLDNVKYSDMNVKDFVLVLHYALRSVRNFVKLLIREMESAKWDIEAAVNAIQPGIIFRNRDHKNFVFESFVCREIFSGFDNPNFCTDEGYQQRIFSFEQFTKMRSENVLHFLKKNPNSLFGKFLRLKYLKFVHPKMEFSFFGNLNQRKMVESGEYPESEFFKMFAEMGRRVWVLHCLAFSFDQKAGIFQVEQNSKFSEVYMESVAEDVFAAADLRVAFTVVPGFKFSRTIVQSQVYLIPTESPAKR